MGFGREIKRLRQEALISVQRIADLVGIDASRWRKWEEKDYSPRREDVIKLEGFFGMDLETLAAQKSIKDFLKVPNQPQGKADIIQHGGTIARVAIIGEGASDLPYLQEYINELKEKTELLKSHNQFLERLVESNLIGISEQQLVLQSEVQAIQQWDAQIAAKGNKAKEGEALGHIHKLTAGNLKRLRKKNTPAEVGK